MKANDLPPIEVLQYYFIYNPENGELRWKNNPGKMRQVGKLAGVFSKSTKSRGYIRIGFDYKSYGAHRIAWALFYGGKLSTTDFIDHINGNRTDNRITNLRKVTRTENNYNRSKERTNTSGHRGVWWDKQTQKWRAGIVVGNKTKSLGRFANIEDAISARLNYERENNIFVRG